MTKDPTLTHPVGLYFAWEGPDRFTLRLKFPGGRLSSAVLRQAAKIAEKGSAFADLTTAQELQLNGLPLSDRRELLELLESSGLRSLEAGETALEPIGCPLTRAGAGEGFDSGVREQPEPDRFTLAIPVMAGRLDADQMRKAADLSERHADGSLGLTPRQNLLLLNVPKDKVAQVLEGLEAVHLSVRAAAAARAMVLCPSGQPGGTGKTDAAGLAGEWASYLDQRVPLDQSFTIHTAGEGGCPDSSAAEIGLQEREGTWDIRIEGRPAAEGVAAHQVRFRLEQLLVGFKRDRASGETLRQFFGRVGEEEIKRLLSESEACALP